MSFTVDAPGKLIVEAASSSTAARALGVDVDGTEQSQDAPVSSSPAQLEFDCSVAVKGSKISIYSKNSGINVFSITWTPSK